MFVNEAKLIFPKCEAVPYGAMQEMTLQLLWPGIPGPGHVISGPE